MITSNNINNKDFQDVIRCLSLDSGCITCLQEDESYLQSILPLICAIQPTSKRPDAYSVNETSILLLEHFQFDNSKVSRKGSVQNQKAAEIDRTFSKILNKSDDFAVISEKVNKNGLFYVENFQKQFNSHARNINDYKLEIQKELGKAFGNIIIGFVIEDSSPLGSNYLDNNKPTCIDLVWSKEFLELFEKTDNLDFVIFAMGGNPNNRIVSFISRNTIFQHKKQQVEVSKIKHLLFENSMCASSLIFIPTKK